MNKRAASIKAWAAMQTEAVRAGFKSVAEHIKAKNTTNGPKLPMDFMNWPIEKYKPTIKENHRYMNEMYDKENGRGLGHKLWEKFYQPKASVYRGIPGTEENPLVYLPQEYKFKMNGDDGLPPHHNVRWDTPHPEIASGYGQDTEKSSDKAMAVLKTKNEDHNSVIYSNEFKHLEPHNTGIDFKSKEKVDARYAQRKVALEGFIKGKTPVDNSQVPTYQGIFAQDSFPPAEVHIPINKDKRLYVNAGTVENESKAQALADRLQREADYYYGKRSAVQDLEKQLLSKKPRRT